MELRTEGENKKPVPGSLLRKSSNPLFMRDSPEGNKGNTQLTHMPKRGRTQPFLGVCNKFRREAYGFEHDEQLQHRISDAVLHYLG
jgi:hypothetical protein